MKKHLLRLLSLLLVLSLTLPASADNAFTKLGDLLSGIFQPPALPVIAFGEMEYTRPDLEQMQSLLEEASRPGDDVSAILDGVFRFYDAYDWFFTASNLVSIHYSIDLTDSYWEEENSFCTGATATVLQMLDDLNCALAQSPCRDQLEQEFFGEGFFDGYGEASVWDDDLVALMDEESQLINQYYTQCGKATSVLGRLFFRPQEAAQTLVDLINVRNRMAAYVGYDSYPDFANDYSYYRDYTPEDMAAYLDGIRDTLVPIYRAAWENAEDLEECQPSQALDYVRQSAQAMGGTVQKAFRLMEEGGLYHIEAGAHKYDSSFEIYLPSYQEPFLFLNPSGTTYDFLDMAHEFGHFCNDYASGGSTAGVDVSEFFSQGFEYLSLCYHPEEQGLDQYKMLDSLSTYVEQACYARFEQEMYQLSEPTVESVCQLFEQVSEDYGLVDEYFSPWDFVFISHYYTNPMYIPSYIVSNDAALQLYQLESSQNGQGLRLYQQSLDTQQPYFLAFLEEAGLESPFAPGRLEEVAQTFREFFPAA